MADLDISRIKGVDNEKLKELEKYVHDGNLDHTKDKLSKLLVPLRDYEQLKNRVKELKKCVVKGCPHEFKVKLKEFEVPTTVDDGRQNERVKELHDYVSAGAVSAFKDKVWNLLDLSYDGYTEWLVLKRAKVYCRLIAVALGLTPQDINEKERIEPDENKLPTSWSALSNRDILQYLLKDVLEEDDEVMTILFLDLKIHKKFPVPYFVDYEVKIIKQTHSLWLSNIIMTERDCAHIEGVDGEKLKELEKCVRDGDLKLAKDKLSELLGPVVRYKKWKERVSELKKCVSDRDLEAFETKLKELGELPTTVPEREKELKNCVRDGDVGGFKDKLWNFLDWSYDGYTERSVLIRAKLYCRLIAVALGLTPQADANEKERFQSYNNKWNVKLRTRLASIEKRDLLQYLLKNVLEEDDEVMTVLFLNLKTFQMNPVPYFVGCEVDIIEQIQSLWLYKYKDWYFGILIDPIIDMVNDASVTGDNYKFIEAKVKLCDLLSKRRLKAGARLFWLVSRKRKVHDMIDDKIVGDKMDSVVNYVDPVGSLVKGIFKTKAVDGNGDSDFMDNFFKLWENYWLNLDLYRDYNITDRVPDGHGQYVCVGLVSSPAHTDGNLLCWAARRNYHDLIWCVMQAYQPPSKSVGSGYNEWIEFERNFVWKMALWCSTRHGDFWRVVRELSDPEWTRTIDFNDYPYGWLPPLHLAAMFGDMGSMETLCKYLKVTSCANRKDYLGRTPLDYAMQFKNTTNESKNCFVEAWIDKVWKKTKDKKTPRYKDVIKNLSSLDGVGERLKELYDMYIHQANTVLIGSALIASVTFAGWLQPPLGFKDYFQFPQPGPSPADGNVYYESYVAIEGHRGVEVFVVFNTLSFFLSIATVLVGAEATLFVHDSDEKTSALIRMRKSIKWMIGFFIGSMLSIMAAFISAGMTILPPIRRLEWSMILSLVAGGVVCTLPLCWIFWSLSRNQILYFLETRFLYPKQITNSNSSKGKRDISERSLISSTQVQKLRDLQRGVGKGKQYCTLQGNGSDVINHHKGKEGDGSLPKVGHRVVNLQQGQEEDAVPQEVEHQEQVGEDANPQEISQENIHSSSNGQERNDNPQGRNHEHTDVDRIKHGRYPNWGTSSPSKEHRYGQIHPGGYESP
ncbi:hypothetical protein KC19_9G095200 [Ceratodon purpureus]|uniref:PGG domain-containing protein n=1 Tax=Ceratodon purpureus TaxID=3225 RepID=A0A8T0GQE3_CERPU|nr:hypothetical protein KC19_N045200 [Ceratodon purpureus]KAG0561826.1 hypothetical protein KC19_9G095200 [Ceratodon purpureus]